MTENTTTTTKNPTRKELLAYIRENFADNMPADMVETLTKWETAMNKPVKKSGDRRTKEQIQNDNDIDKIVEWVRQHGEPVSAREVLENFPFVRTVQKATGLLRRGVKRGLLVSDATKKTTVYGTPEMMGADTD